MPYDTKARKNVSISQRDEIHPVRTHTFAEYATTTSTSHDVEPLPFQSYDIASCSPQDIQTLSSVLSNSGFLQNYNHSYRPKNDPWPSSQHLQHSQCEEMSNHDNRFYHVDENTREGTVPQSDEISINTNSTQSCLHYSGIWEPPQASNTNVFAKDLRSIAPSCRSRTNKRDSLDVTISSDDIKKEDVLFGRGKKSTNHPGNTYFRELVSKSASHYKTCSKIDKTIMANQIVETVHQRGGRFLCQQVNNGWVQVKGLIVRKKTSQALRDCNVCRRKAAT